MVGQAPRALCFNGEITMNKSTILEELEENVFRFMSRLRKPGRVGRYFPCEKGLTKYGEKAELGLSCFAMKVFYIFGWWEGLPRSEKNEWVEHINSYLVVSGEENGEYLHAYIDPILVNYLREPSLSRYVSKIRSTSIHELMKLGRLRTEPPAYERAIVAETKQAIATLAEVGVQTRCKAFSFAQTPEDVLQYMSKFDWSLPWSAGGQTASLAVFLSVQAPQFLSFASVEKLRDVMRQYYRTIADRDSGGYFTGTRPTRSMLINGAMKVLTALDWLDEPIHYPRRLIDTVLQFLPVAQGCDLVDAIYVLFRCLKQDNYKRKEIECYLLSCIKIIAKHQQPDGGFSYSIGQAQKWYYGMPISRGLKEGDLHGTVLLVWALVMIASMIEPGRYSWKVIRP